MMAMTPTTSTAATANHATRAPRTLREYFRISKTRQKDLARCLGVHQSTVSMLTAGLRAARWKLAQKIHEKTGVPIAKLLVAPNAEPRPSQAKPKQKQKPKP